MITVPPKLLTYILSSGMKESLNKQLRSRDFVYLATWSAKSASNWMPRRQTIIRNQNHKSSEADNLLSTDWESSLK